MCLLQHKGSNWNFFETSSIDRIEKPGSINKDYEVDGPVFFDPISAAMN